MSPRTSAGVERPLSVNVPASATVWNGEAVRASFGVPNPLMQEIAAQAFALALDPYPQSTLPAPGVITEEAARAESTPFAIVKKK